MIVGSFAKKPDEVRDFPLDWSQELGSGDTIVASLVEVLGSPAGLMIDADSFTVNSVTFIASAGDVGTLYEVRNTVTTNNGLTLIASVYVTVTYLEVGVTSYVTLAEADEYHGPAQSTTWMGYNASTREGYLIRATRLLNRQRWLGEKTDPAQALAWPRTGTGVTGVEDDVIPQAIKDACSEIALAIGSGSADVENEQSTAQKLQRIKAGSVELEYFRGAEGSPHRFPTIVNELLRDYLVGSGALAVSGVATGVGGTSSTEDDFGHTEGI